MLTILEQLITWGSGLKILYVEDDLSLQEEVSILLSDIFDVVDLAENGQKGIEKIYNKEYDLIITDIRMPVLNGIKLIEKLKNENIDIPVVVFSAHNEVEYLVKLINLDIENFVTKPIRSEQIFSVLHKVTRRIHNQKELRRYQDELEIANEKLKNIVNTQSKNIDLKTSLLKSYRDAIYNVALVSTTNPEGVITDVNENFCEVYEYSREEIIGNTHALFRHPDNDIGIYKKMWDTILSKKIWHGTIINQSKTFKTIHSYTTNVPVLDSQGKIFEFLSVSQNLTKMQEMNENKLAQSIKSSSSIKQVDILNTLPFASVIFDKKSKINYFNKLFENFISELVHDNIYTQLVSNSLHVNDFLEFKGLITIEDYDFIDTMCSDEDIVSLEASVDTIEGEISIFLKIKKLDDNSYIASIISKEDFLSCSLVQEN